MTLTIAVLLASAAVYSWKFFGYLVPEKLLERPAISRVAALLTVALLAALMATQALTKSGEIKFDARIPSLLVAAVLLRFKAPFLVVVISAAASAALLRWLGL